MARVYEVHVTPREDTLAHFETLEGEKHQIDEHNNLHIVDENYEDLYVFKHTEWARFAVTEVKE